MVVPGLLSLLLVPFLANALDFAQLDPCLHGGVYNEATSKCYIFVNVPLEFLAAERLCETYDGYLVSIRSADEQQYVLESVDGKFNMDFWLGGYYFNSGPWKWISDHTAFVYDNFRGGPVYEPSRGCVAAAVRGGKWYDTTCYNTAKMSVCETNPTYMPPKSTTTPTTTVTPTTLPPTEWKQFNNSNAWFKLYPGLVAEWNEMEKACIAEGGHLPSIHSDEENMFVAELGNLLDESSKCGYFAIGFKSANVFPYEFAWTDGTPADFATWTTEYPRGNDSFCVLTNFKEMTWINWFCDKRAENICRVCKKVV